MSDHNDTQPASDAPVRAAASPPRTTALADEQQLVPVWLAVLVLVLLLAVMAVGGYVVHGLVSGGTRAQTPQQVDVQAWSARVQASPKSPQAHLGLGYSYEIAGQYDKALAEYATVIKMDPSNTAAYYNQGVVYAKTGDTKNAERSWWKALGIDKTHALAAKSLGDYYAAKQQYKSLLVAVDPAVAAHPEMADLEYLSGMANEKLGNTAVAIQRYEAALKYSPDMDQARAGLKRLGVNQ